MFATIKPQVFLDSLTLELFSPQINGFKAVLKDDKGSICRSMETDSHHQNSLTWNGLNDLPYGVYTVELQSGNDEMKVRLVKRV
ncbi:MAG: hypothetical protein ABL872_18865 [Lacibacter sp.]|nr:hypothetical protein [Chitinophagaceae bacterium]